MTPYRAREVERNIGDLTNKEKDVNVLESIDVRAERDDVEGRKR
jgi:hypothetical protein